MFTNANFADFQGLANKALPVVVDMLAKGVVLLALVAMGLICFRRSSAAKRHLAWFAAMVGLLLLPMLSACLPGWEVLPAWMGASGSNSSTVPGGQQASSAQAQSEVRAFLASGELSADTLVTLPASNAPAGQEIGYEWTPVGGVRSDETASVSQFGDRVALSSSTPTSVAGVARRQLPSVWLISIWSVGAVALLLRLLVSQFGLWRLARRSCRVTQGALWESVQRVASSLAIRSPIRLILSRDRRIPMTWGFFRPHLLLPMDAEHWDDARLQSVLMHELAHVQRRDCQTQLVAQVACALHWLNPLAWLAIWRMDIEREQACDDLVLSSGVPAPEYAAHLVGVAAGLSRHDLAACGALSMARPSRMESRLLMILNGSLSRGRATAGLRFGIVVTLMGLVLPMSMLHSVRLTANAAEASDQVAQVPPAGRQAAGDVVKEGAWSEPVDGLQFRLSAPRTEFESWELPWFVFEVRNQGGQPVTAAQAESLIGDFRKRPGLLFLFKDQHRRAPTNENRWLVPQIRFDEKKIIGLEPGKSISHTVTLASLREESSPDWDPYNLTPGRYSIGLGSVVARLESQLLTNVVTLNMLPPGVRKLEELATWLKPYVIGTQSLEAGFVPNKTTLVSGEPMFVTMVVRNLSDEVFAFGFGADYRGTGRHGRFKIEAKDAGGNTLADPLAQEGRSPDDGGGLVMWRTARARDVAVETVQLATYRTFPGPGEYTVSCRFDLTPHWMNEGNQKFNVPVVTSYKLTILPREPAHVQRVLDELFERSRQTGSAALTELVDTISSFGKGDAVPGFSKLITTGDTEHRIAAAAGLGKVTTAESLRVLLQARNDEQLSVRVAVVAALGQFTDKVAVQTLIRALSDADELIRTTAANSLGRSKTGDAVDALIQRLPDSTPAVGAAILRAMGATKSPRVFATLERSLGSEDDLLRRAALDGILNFPSGQGVRALLPLVTHANIDFREAVIRTLAEVYKQAIDPQWLVPVIKSRRGTRSIGDAPRLLRLYTSDKAAPALLSCLDFENPDIRNYYNLTIIDNQLACNGLAIPWIGDLNRDGTPEEIEQNRRTLKQIKTWVDHYAAHPWEEPALPWQLPQAEEEATWSAPVDDLSIRAHTNRIVWPRGLPQVVNIEARSASGGGSVVFNEPLVTCEVEVNGQWYARESNSDSKVTGNWNAYQGHPLHDLQLDSRWQRLSDKQRLDLPPGRYTVRVRLGSLPKGEQTGLAMTKPIQFEVIPD